MANKRSLTRIFRLILLLKRKPYKSVSFLAKLLEVDKRQIYRDLELLEEVGYLIDHDSQHKYFLFLPESESYPQKFSLEETQLLQALVKTMKSHPLKNGLEQKLFSHSDLIPLANSLLSHQTADILRQLQEALHSGKQVLLTAYHSTSSKDIKDRLVEPLGFSADQVYLKAFEPSSQQVKSFKLERIGGVELLEESCTYSGKVGENDLFGCSGPKPLMVELLLSHRAYRLLIEEFPGSQPYVRPIEGSFPYRALLTVRAFEGVGRFILGLPGEIQLKGPRELQAYLSRKVALYEREGEVNG